MSEAVSDIAFEIRQADEGDIPALYALYREIGKKDEGYFEACFEKDCVLLIAFLPSHVIPAVSEADLNSGDPEESHARSAMTCGSRSSKQADACTNAMTEVVNVGFGILNFEPKYNLYKKLEIPEIQDLNVIPEARQQGIATMLVEAFENLARDQGSEQVGISVGLTKDYGPAQRLYCKLGYMPDGNGIAYDREGVTAGQSYSVDDDLCLMMVKEL